MTGAPWEDFQEKSDKKPQAPWDDFKQEEAAPADLDSLDHPAETFAKTALDEYILNYYPELAGAIKAPFTGKPYVEQRDIEAKHLIEGQNANPVASTAGKATGIVGQIATPIPGMAAIGNTGRFYKGASGALKLAETAAQGAAKGLAVGSALNFVKNPGSDEGVVDPVQLDERVSNVDSGKLWAAGAGVAGEFAGQGLKKIAGQKNRFTVRAMEPTPSKSERILYRDNSIDDLGNFAREHKMLDGASSSEDIARNAMAAERSHGQKIKDFYAQFKQKISPDNAPMGAMDLILLKRHLKNESLKLSNSSGAVEDIMNEVKDKLAGFRQRSGANNLDITDLHELRRSMQGGVNYDTLGMTPKDQSRQELASEAAKYINKIIEREVESVSASGGPQAVKELRNLNRSYHLASDIVDMTQKASGKDFSKRFSFSVPGAVAGASAGSLVGPKTAAIMGITGGLGQMAFPTLGDTAAIMAAKAANKSEASMGYINAGRMGVSPGMIAGYNLRETQVITDANQAQAFEQDINNNPDLSPTQRAKRLNLLRKHNRIYIGQ